ncbi:hypothetical protein BN946_scf185043.g87 [Trametes cinnabarina]|uniref:Golgi apparatus membrane protein TVP38 n=1 Tax=Pycnoporus cinnabarinus TaxID=5643 RepID=A0A060SHQ0_PYCCI|nr:hypothetical protein BN946_scf185043.g87 [Trametes cinnabarina]
MPNRLGQPSRVPHTHLAQAATSTSSSPSQAFRQPPTLPHRFAHLQEVYDEKAGLSQPEDQSKSPAGLTSDMASLPGPSFSRSQAPSPVSSIPPWIRSQRPPHSRPSPLQPPFSPAPCPIASSWASPSSLHSSSPYTRPRGLRIANLIKPWIPIILYISTTLGFLAAVSFWKVEVFQGLDKLSRWLQSDTYLGYAVIFALIFITTFPPIPLYSTLIILSGYTFGPWTGAIISYWASLAGALVVFTVSRTFFRASISRWLSCTVTIKRVVRAIENNPKLLFLIRLAPYPYNVMNCLLAASPSLTLRTYTMCTALSLLKLIIHTSIGSSIHSFASYHVSQSSDAASATGEDDQGSTLSHYSTAAGIVLCLAIFVYLSYITRKAVDEELQDEDALDARYSEERVAFLANEDPASLDVEEAMVEARLRAPIAIRSVSMPPHTESATVVGANPNIADAAAPAGTGAGSNSRGLGNATECGDADSTESDSDA